ncbi:MAG TPA: hypothetical protein VGF95_15755 [Solirubrobacteraceae bacterium]|jgi:hypothetical protein
MSQFRHPEGASATCDEDRRVDRAIVGLLLDPSSTRPWSSSELVLELDAERPTALDGIDRLHRAGIVHRCGDFVFATRAATVLDKVLGY